MSYIRGGDTDKRGNYYENKFVVAKFAELLSGEIFSVQQETYITDEESGVDIIVVGNIKKYYQCKARNGIEDRWTIASLINRGIIDNAVKHICKGIDYVFVTPISIPTVLKDFCERSTIFDELSIFELNALGGKDQVKEYNTFKNYLTNILKCSDDQVLAFFHKFSFEKFSDEEVFVKRMLSTIGQIVEAEKAYDFLCGYVETHNKIGISINITELRNYLEINEVSFYSVNKENEILKISQLQKEFIESINRKRINSCDYARKETKDIIETIKSNKFTIVYGEAASGKSVIIKQLCDQLIAESVVFLPININANIPNGNLSQYSKELGLSQTIGRSLYSISDNKKVYLILDQLDTIRWNASLVQNSKNICHEIIKESLVYDDISVIFVIRKIDVQNIRNVILYEQNARNDKRNISEIAIKKIDSQTISTIIPEYASLNSAIRNLLSTIGNVKLYIEIKNTAKKNITTTPELIEAFIAEKIQELSERGFNQQPTNILGKFVDYMRINNTLSISKSLLSISEKECIEAMKNVGLIDEVSTGRLAFIHQTLFDYYIARSLYIDYCNGIAVNKILKQYNNIPLEKFETIKQFLELLLRNHEEEFCTVIEKSLFDKSIRFMLRRLLLDFYIIANPASKNYVLLFRKIIKSKMYGEKYIFQLTSEKDILVEDMINNGIAKKYLESETKKRVMLDILLSVPYNRLSVSCLIDYFSELLAGDYIEHAMYKIDDLRSCDELFEIKLLLIKKDIIHDHYISLDAVLNNNIDRVFKYLEVLFGDGKELKVKVDVTSEKNQDAWDALYNKYGKQINDLTRKFFATLKDSHFKLRYFDSRALHSYDNIDFAISLFISTIGYLDTETIWEYLNDESKDARFYIDTILSEIPSFHNYGLSILIKMIDNKYILKQNFNVHRKRIFKIKEIISVFANGLSNDKLSELEAQILQYKVPNFLEHVKVIMKYKKEGFWHNFYGEEQKILLEAMPNTRLLKSTKDYLFFLQRKFANYDLYNPFESDGFTSYNVVSGINTNKTSFSRKKWLEILTSQKAGKTEKRFKDRFDEKGNALSCDLEYFTSMIFDAAYENRALFADILITEENIRPDFTNTVLNAISSRFINKKCIIECDEKTILDAHKKYYSIENYESVSALINFAQHCDYRDDWLDSKLLELAVTPNMKICNHISNDFEENWSRHFSNTQSGSICALARNVWQCRFEPEWFKSIFEICFSSDDMQMAIAGLEILCPLYNIDRKATSEFFFKLIYKFPTVIQSSEAMKILDVIAFNEYEKCNALLDTIENKISNKVKASINERIISYYCFYNTFAYKAKRIIKESEVKNTNNADKSVVTRSAVTCVQLLNNNNRDDVVNRIEIVIRWIIKYNPSATSDLLLYIDKNLRFFHERNLIVSIIKNCAYKNVRDMHVHSLDRFIKDLPELYDYRSIIFAAANRLCEKSKDNSFDAVTISQWINTLYWEIKEKDKKLKRKCINTLDLLHKKFHFNIRLSQEIN